MENGCVDGEVYIDNTWKSVRTKIPTFIDISPYCMKRRNKSIMQYLRQNTSLSDKGLNRFSKEKLQNLLKEDDAFSHLVIPTIQAAVFEDVLNFVDTYGTIVLKPVSGERGVGVFILNKTDAGFVLGHSKEESDLSEHGLEQFFQENIAGKKYILQKYVQSRTVQGDPFDCRVHVEKNRKGKWQSARHFIRMGIGQKVVSNVSQGGGIGDVEPFLKANFGDGWKDIDQRLNELADTLPYKFENLRGYKMMSLGMDVGIDQDGRLYLFEINTAPITSPLRDRAAMLRVDYYTYKLRKELNTQREQKMQDRQRIEQQVKTESQKLQNECERLEKEMAYYKKQYEKMTSSTSWKVSKPIRSLGKIKKRFK